MDDVAQTGDPLIDIETSGAATEDAEQSPGENKQEVQETEAIHIGDAQAGIQRGAGKVLATPAVRRLAAEHKLNLNEIPGTGKDGRILKDDIFKFLDESQGQTSPSSPPRQLAQEATRPSPAAPPTPPTIKRGPTVIGQDKTEKFTVFQQAMTKSMTNALQIPHFGYKDEIDMTKMVHLRKELKYEAKERGIKLSYMPFVLKAASLALREHPILNASIDLQKETVTYKASHNLGCRHGYSRGSYRSEH